MTSILAMRNISFTLQAQLVCIAEHLDCNAGPMLHGFHLSFVHPSASLDMENSWFFRVDDFAWLLIDISVTETLEELHQIVHAI